MFKTGNDRALADHRDKSDGIIEVRLQALQDSMLSSANFAIIVTDEVGVIQIFNVGAESMLGYTAAEVLNRITPADISDPQELIARAKALSLALATTIRPGFEALVFKASRGIQDIYELTYIRKDGSRFPAIVSVATLHDNQNQIIGYLLIGTDNTARKQIEAEQMKLDQRLHNQHFYTRSLIESSIDALMTTNPSGIITDVNKQMEALTGCTRDELIGAPFKNYFTDRELAQEGIKLVLSEKKVTDYELTARARDGKETVVSYNATTFYDRNRTLQGVFAAARDVTVQKQASQYARSLIEASLDPLVTISAQGKITDVNEASVEATGVPREHLIGTDFSDYFTEPDKARAGYQKVFSEGVVRDYPLAIRHATGRIMDVLYNATVYKDGKGKVQGVFAAARDVTAQKQASQYARSLIEASLDPLVTISAQGKITDVNEASVEATGVPREHLIGTDFSDYFTEPDKARAGYQKVFSEGVVRDYPLAIRHATGRIMDVLYNATVYKDGKGKVQGVFAAARDVTQRNGLDQVLHEKNVALDSARAVAEKASLAKSEFLSSMSHELRSPLNAILGFAQLMDSDATPPTPAQKENIAQILHAGWHLLDLINEILDLTKVESGQVPISREPVSLAEVLVECQAMIEPQAQQRGIKPVFLRCGTPYFVRADRTRVKQVLINLLTNAIKYNIKQGTIEVKCTEHMPGRIRVSIRDTGAGLNPEQLAQLFQPFNRLGQEAGGEEGTGIGLVVAKRLVELMDGTIGAESTVGVGSVFWFELISVAEPHLSLEGGDARALAQPRVPRGDRLQTLLYIEDNPANMKLVEQIIARRPDMRLVTAVNGKNGIQSAHISLPDVILTDINLPDLNGLEVLKILRSDPATAHIPVIAISANAMPLDIERGRKAGFVRYITKPIKVNEFIDALDLALESAGKALYLEPVAK